MNTKIIRILHCTDGMMWYANQIGGVFKYKKTILEEKFVFGKILKVPKYVVTDNEGYSNNVDSVDAERGERMDNGVLLWNKRDSKWSKRGSN